MLAAAAGAVADIAAGVVVAPDLDVVLLEYVAA